MTWIMDLSNLYDQKFQENVSGLLPISHVEKTAHVQVEITSNGEFIQAVPISKDQRIKVIPATIDAANRTGKMIAPFPLHEKLQYLTETSPQKRIDKESHFQRYLKQLEKWRDSEHGHPILEALYFYIRKNELFSDLIKASILVQNEKGYLEMSQTLLEMPNNSEQLFIFFRVRIDRNNYFNETDLVPRYIAYYQEQLSQKELCYASGEVRAITSKHGSKIISPSDKGKLLSANDANGFTFRGRFTTGLEAVTIGYDVSEKAHHILRWLIRKVGVQVGKINVLLFSSDEELFPSIMVPGFYKQPLKRNLNVEVYYIVLCATTVGRLSILQFMRLPFEEYEVLMARWCKKMTITYLNEKNSSVSHPFSINEIVHCLHGKNGSVTEKEKTYQRLLSCFFHQNDISKDLLHTLIKRAHRPTDYTLAEWNKIIGLTVTLLSKKYTHLTGRSYLFGRLFAVAHYIEVQIYRDKLRVSSNILSKMDAFSNKPLRTWYIIERCIRSYKNRTRSDYSPYSDLLEEVKGQIGSENFSDTPLSEEWLLGFYHQHLTLVEIFEKKTK